MPDERSAGAVVYRPGDERRYLVLRYRNGHWGFVKGHVEAGESIEDTVRREAEEETGLDDLELHGDFRDHVTYTFQRGDDVVEKRVDFLLARTSTEEVEVGSPQEHTDVAWVTYDDALERLTFEDMRDLLREADERAEGAQSSLDAWTG